MTALAAAINATERTLTLSGNVSSASPGRRYSVEDEVVVLERFGELPPLVGGPPEGIVPWLWIVQRGAEGTAPVAHDAGAVVYGVRPSFARGSGIEIPSPVGGPGGSHPDLASHESLGLATDSALANHAGTAHGTQAHAIGGASHTGSLTAADVGAATTGHTHDYAATSHGTHLALGTTTGTAAEGDHAHAGGSHPDLAAHDTLGLATQSELNAHEGAVNPHATYLTGAEGDAAYSATGHTHGGAFPVGSVFLSVVATNPATLLGYGTWAAFGAGRMLLGWNTGDTDEATGGATTHTHAGHIDHAALSHSGATVGNHAVTQPSAHADHTLSGSIATENAHTHAYTQTVNHVHVQNAASVATGGLVGSTPDASTNTSVASGYSTANPTGGVASGTTAAGSAHGHGNGTLAVSAHGAHAGTAVDAHSVGQASQHAAQSHSAHDSPSNLPPYVIVRMWKRTA